MRSVLGLGSVLVIATAHSSSAIPRYAFEFTVVLDDAAPVTLSVAVPPGTTHSLQATNHLRFEVEAPAGTGGDATTVVRLIDDSSGKARVLHTARRLGPSGLVRTAGYAVCGGRTTFQSPLQSVPLTCAVTPPAG